MQRELSEALFPGLLPILHKIGAHVTFATKLPVRALPGIELYAFSDGFKLQWNAGPAHGLLVLRPTELLRNTTINIGGIIRDCIEFDTLTYLVGLEVWYGQPIPVKLADDYPSYLRLQVSFLGLDGWQSLFLGSSPHTRDWLGLFCGERAAELRQWEHLNQMKTESPLDCIPQIRGTNKIFSLHETLGLLNRERDKGRERDKDRPLTARPGSRGKARSK